MGKYQLIGSRKFWFGMVISVLLLVVFLSTVDIRHMIDAFSGADYLFLVPGVGLYLGSLMFRTLRWQVLLRPMKSVGLRRLFPVVVVGYMANNLLPMRLGELVRSHYLGEREGISKTAALATILVERVLDALMLLFFIAAVALFVPLTGLAESFGERFDIPWPLLVLFMSGPFLIAFVVLLSFASFPPVVFWMVEVLLKPSPVWFKVRMRDLLDHFLVGLRPMRSPRTLTVLFVMSAPVWLFEAGLFYFVGFSFGLNHVFDHLGELAVAAVVVTAIANIGSSIPAAPGGLGLFELVARETLVFFPLAVVDRPVAGAIATVFHASLLLPTILMGQVFLWTENVSLRSLFYGGMTQRTQSSTLERSE